MYQYVLHICIIIHIHTHNHIRFKNVFHRAMPGTVATISPGMLIKHADCQTSTLIYKIRTSGQNQGTCLFKQIPTPTLCPHILMQRLSIIFCKEQDSKCLRPSGPYFLCCNYSVLSLQHKSSYRYYRNDCAWLHFYKTLFRCTGISVS